MAEINKVGLNLGQKIANPFKTSRNMSTPNPFKNSNFEGNTLQFADVFEGCEAIEVKQNKLKMIASSVAGSARKLHSSITEPIVNFVRKIGGGISNAWDYAKNTNVSDLPGIKSINEVMNADIVDLGRDLGHGISNSISNMGKGISDKVASLNNSVTERLSSITGIGKTLSAKLDELVESLNISNGHKITAETSVNELKEMWLEENRLLAESKVA